MKNTVAVVRKQMEELRAKKDADIQTIEKKRQEAAQDAQKAQEALDNATTEMDLTAYEQAQESLRKALVTEQMYKGRADQLRRQEIISEEESDQVIDSLLAYEDALADKLAADIAPHMKALEEILTAYKSNVKETETTIAEWTSTIHANYRREGSSRIGPDGKSTNRLEYPVPVHAREYPGSDASQHLDRFLHGPIAQHLPQ